MGANDMAEDAYYDYQESDIKEDVNLNRATRFPGDVFWRLSKYLNGSQGNQLVDAKKEGSTKKWLLILVGVLVVLGIATIIVLSIGVPLLKKKPLILTDNVNININDYIFDIPARAPVNPPMTIDPFAEKERNSLFSVAAPAAITLAASFAIGDIVNKQPELRNSRFSSAVEFTLSNTNKYFLCLDEVPKESYVHLAQHLCGAAATAGTIQTIYGTSSATVTKLSKLAAKGVYECTSPTSCTIKACTTCTCNEVISATCVPGSVPIPRAIQGRYPEEGFLQLFVEQKWGYVCVNDYQVGPEHVCKLLGAGTAGGFARFTEVKQQACDTAPRNYSHFDIVINCPVTAASISDCIFENKPCSGKYVWVQCEPFVSNYPTIPRSTYFTPNSRYIYPSPASVSAPGNDFEAGMGGWTQETTDDFDWFRHTGTNTTAYTGPSCTDSTTDVNKFYLMIDASSPRRPGQKAVVYSPQFTTTGQCLRFKYSIHGDGGGTLRVFLKTSPTASTDIQSFTSALHMYEDGRIGNYWKTYSTSLADVGSAQLAFEATRGPGMRSDFAIDDVEIGPCSDAAYASDCMPYHYRCPITQQCLPEGYKCNNDVQCQTAEEGTCMAANANMYVCPNNVSIPMIYRCDGQRSCMPDNDADETGCGACQSYETACGNGLCYQATQQCDMKDDCGNGADEIGCTVCAFRCTSDNRCLSDAKMRCNGDMDCADNSDEASCNTDNDFTDSTRTDYVFSNVEIDATGMYRPLTEDLSSYQNPAAKTSTTDTWGFITIPVHTNTNVQVRCLSFRYAGMTGVTSSVLIQIAVNNGFLTDTWAPMSTTPTAQGGAFRLSRVQFDVPYNSSTVRITFALLNALLDDITMTSAACASTPSQPAITPQGVQLPYTVSNTALDGTTCDFGTGTCDMEYTGMFHYGTTPFWERLFLTNGRGQGRLGFYFDSKATVVSVSTTGFTQEMLNAVCQMRGYSSGTAVTSYGPGTGACMTISCPSPLKDISECFHNGITTIAANCNHNLDIGIVCSTSLFPDAELNSLAGRAYMSTDRQRGSGLLKARVSSAVQCVQFEYKIPSKESWIYAGGVSYNSSTADTINLFENLGATFTAQHTAGQWVVAQAPITMADEVFLIMQSPAATTIQITNVTFMTTACTLAHPYESSSELLCDYGRQSYPLLAKCNGKVECMDGSDESPTYCNSSSLCDSTIPANRSPSPFCSAYTVDGQMCNATCIDGTQQAAPDGTTGLDFCYTSSGWGFCNKRPTFAGNAGGAMCRDTFTYKGTTYSGCTGADNGINLWCGVTFNYDTSGYWARCASDCASFTSQAAPRVTTSGANCTFPFVFAGMVFQGCTQLGWYNEWCSLTHNYDVDKQWGDCQTYSPPADPPKCRDRTSRGSFLGKRCTFPFTYNGVTYNYCPPDPNNWNRPWCSYDSVYQGNWGYCEGCPNPDPFWVYTLQGTGNAGGQACVLPFYYTARDGVRRLFEDCTELDANRLWCSTTHDYDLSKSWAYCQDTSSAPYKRHPVCLGTAKHFDADLDGGTQATTDPIRWRHTNNVTKTGRTSPKLAADKRMPEKLNFADLPSFWGKGINTLTSQGTLGYIYADMSDPSIPPGSSGSITFSPGSSLTPCIRFCYHMVGRQAGSLHVSFNGGPEYHAVNGPQEDPLAITSTPHRLRNDWRCVEIWPFAGSFNPITSVRFRAVKGNGPEGDIALDEVIFSENCHQGYGFICPDNYTSCNDGQCIPKAQRCDCMRQCLDGSDELNCQASEFPACRAGQFACGQGCCINQELKCNGFSNCPNGMDESAATCNGVINALNTTSIASAVLTTAASGEVFPEYEKCNGYADTVTGDDEKNCNCSSSSTLFSCQGRCLPMSRVCDKRIDCVGMEDEFSSCPQCSLDMFTCDDQTCVPLTSLCNGTKECPDGSDEPAHQCGTPCTFSMTNLTSAYTSLVVGTPPSTIAYGSSYTLNLTCAGSWWSPKTSCNTRCWFTYECIEPGAVLGPSAAMDVQCIPTMDPGLLPAGTSRCTDPINFGSANFTNIPFGLSPFRATGSKHVKIKGKQVTSLNVWKTGLVSLEVPSGVTAAPTNYKFMDKANLQFKDVFSILSIEVDPANPGYVFFDQYNGPKFGDTLLDTLINTTCAVVVGGCSSSTYIASASYAAVITFHQVRDTAGNIHNAQLALVSNDNETVALHRYVTTAAVDTNKQLGMLLMTTDTMRPDVVATSGNLMNHGTHGVNGDYMQEIADFVTIYKPASILPYGSGTSDTTVTLKTFTGPTSTMAASPGLNMFGYIINETALIPAGGRVAFGDTGATYETSGCINSSLTTEQVTFTALNTAFSPASSSGFVHHRFTTTASELALVKTEVCAAQNLTFSCASWNPTLAYVVTYQGIMLDDGTVDLTGYGNTYQMIIITDGLSTFGVVHYAKLLSYWDYGNCLEYRGAWLKMGLLRELVTGNTRDSYFDAQTGKNASTTGAYVVDFRGFPCPIPSGPTNFTLSSDPYPNPLLTGQTHPFTFLCNNGSGSPFDGLQGMPGPGRVLNPWNITCTPQKQGLPINFDQEINGFECKAKLYFFGSEMGTGAVTIANNYTTQSFSTGAVVIKGQSYTSFSVSNTGILSSQTPSEGGTCLPLRSPTNNAVVDMFKLFGVPMSPANIFFDSFSSTSGNAVHQALLARAKTEVCAHLSQPVATCTFTPTHGVVMTVLDSMSAAPASASNKLTGQVVLVASATKTYAILVYADWANSSAAGCPEELGILTQSADLHTVTGDPTTTSNFGITGEHIFEVGEEKTSTITSNFFTPLPSNIMNGQPASGNLYGTQSLTGGSLSVFGYTFSSFEVSQNLAALVFGGTDTADCHDIPITNTNPEVFIIMKNWKMEFQTNTRMYIGDTNDTATVTHFKDSVCAEVMGLCPSWTPNRVVVITILGIDTDNTGGRLSGSWQAAIVTDGSSAYLVATYGIDTSFGQQGSCMLKFSGAVVNGNLTRYLDIDPTNPATPLTTSNVWDRQLRMTSNKEGTYVISLNGFPCNVSNWVPMGFSGVATFPTTLPTTGTFNQQFTCVGGFGLPFDANMGFSDGGGIKMNNQTITCTPAIQGSTIGFSQTNGFPLDLTGFICLPFYYCCTEAGTAKIAETEFGANGFVIKNLAQSLKIKDEMFSSVTIYRSGIVTFRTGVSYTDTGCFSFLKLGHEVSDMAPIFSVLASSFKAGGGVFMNELQPNSSDSYITEALASISNTVNTNITGASGFTATYALLITYVFHNTTSQNAAQLTIATDGTNTYVIVKYGDTVVASNTAPCYSEVGIMLQSTDIHDFGVMASGGPLKNSGNAGLGTYAFEIGQRNVQTKPTHFFPFGPEFGDEEINIASMSGEVTSVSRNLSPTLRVHDYDYDKLLIMIDGTLVLGFQNQTIPDHNSCSATPEAAAPKQATYIKALPTDFTNNNTYGAIYYRLAPANTSDAAYMAVASTFSSKGMPLTFTPTLMLVVTYHGIRFNNQQAAATFQVIVLTDGNHTKALIAYGPVTEYGSHGCFSNVRSIVNRDKMRDVAMLDAATLASWVGNTTDQFQIMDLDGFDCTLNSSTTHLMPFLTNHTFPSTLRADSNETYMISCDSGFGFDYTRPYSQPGRPFNPQTVECPAYVQGETRYLPDVTDFQCLKTIYECCGNSALNVASFNSGGFYQQTLTNTGFNFDGPQYNNIKIGLTGLLTVENNVLMNNLPSPTCVNTTTSNMTKYLNYISLLGQEFNYTEAGGIFFEEYTSGHPVYTATTADITLFKGSAFTPSNVFTVTYMNVKDPGSGLNQTAQVAFAYDSAETYIIMSYEQYSITDTPTCKHELGIRTKSANHFEIARPNVNGSTNVMAMGARNGVYIWENFKYQTKSKQGVTTNMFDYVTADNEEIYTINNAGSSLTDDGTAKHVISTLSSSAFSTFNVFDYDYTHMGVGPGMLYFGNAPTAADTFPEETCTAQNQGSLNVSYVTLMSHDQNPVISPGAQYIKALTTATAAADLARITALVCAYDSTTCGMWTATTGLIVTFAGLTGVTGQVYANTYQAAFGSDGARSFVIFIYGIITDYAGPDCFRTPSVRPPVYNYRTIIDHIPNGTYDRDVYFDSQFFTNCPNCVNNTGLYVLDLDGLPCTWDTTMLGCFTAQMGCCNTTIKTLDSITIEHQCPVGYIHKYSGTDESPPSTNLTCTAPLQGTVLSLTNVPEYNPLFPYICLKKFIPCCHNTSATALDPAAATSGWFNVTLQTNILVKGTQHSTAWLSNTGYLFFNETVNMSPPDCHNFTTLANRALLPGYSIFSQTLQFTQDENDSTKGRIYIEQFTMLPASISNLATINGPTFALLISVVEAPLSTTSGPRQSAQLLIITNGTESESILTYEKFNVTSTCQVGAMFKSADFLDVQGESARTSTPVAGSTYRIIMGQNITNTLPANMISISNAEKIPFSKFNDPNKVLNDDKDVQRMLGANYTLFGQMFDRVAMTDNGYLTVGTSVTPFPDEFCLAPNGGYRDLAYLMALNYDQKPEFSSGALYFEETTDSAICGEFTQEICAAPAGTTASISCTGGSAFTVDRALIMTVTGIATFDERYYKNSYQLIVATDTSQGKSFGIIIYGLILGYRGDVDCEQWRGTKYSFSTNFRSISHSPYSHDEIFNAQFWTNARTIGRFVVSMNA